MLEAEWDQQRGLWWGEPTGAGATRGSSGNQQASAWRTVRVFISSTFRDMHGERDAITRHVFPALNQRARSRRIRAVPVDLRWGLTSEDTSDAGLGALEHCLLEIDASRPFVVVLSGERYGWIPPSYRVTDRPEFEWVKRERAGRSITDMEVRHAFLRRPYTPVHALAYQRDPSFLQPARAQGGSANAPAPPKAGSSGTATAAAGKPPLGAAAGPPSRDTQEHPAGTAPPPAAVPEEHAAIFRFDHLVPSHHGHSDRQQASTAHVAVPPGMEPNPAVLALRSELRDGMNQHQYCRNRSYSCRFGGLDAEGKPVVTDLQAFEAMMLEDLWEAICVEFPPPPPPLPFLALEATLHASMVAARARTFVGRARAVEAMATFANQPHVDAAGRRPLVVVGRSGIGKTSLVLTFAHRYRTGGGDVSARAQQDAASALMVYPFMQPSSASEGGSPMHFSGVSPTSLAVSVTSPGGALTSPASRYVAPSPGGPRLGGRSGAAGPAAASGDAAQSTSGAQQMPPAIVTFSVRASPMSRDLRSMLLLLCRALHEAVPTLDVGTPEGLDIQGVKDGWRTVLAAAGEEALALGSRVVVVVDSVDSLAPFGGALSMDWWPTTMPRGVVGIVSTTPDSLTYASLRSRDPAPHEVEVRGLEVEERRAVVSARLDEYRKKLTAGQMEMLLAKGHAGSPLYLLTSCEELRLQAQYGIQGEGVEEMIQGLPHTTEGLLDVVLNRVEEDMGAWTATVDMIGGGGLAALAASVEAVLRQREADARKEEVRRRSLHVKHKSQAALQLQLQRGGGAGTGSAPGTRAWGARASPPVVGEALDSGRSTGTPDPVASPEPDADAGPSRMVRFAADVTVIDESGGGTVSGVLVEELDDDHPAPGDAAGDATTAGSDEATAGGGTSAAAEAVGDEVGSTVAGGNASAVSAAVAPATVTEPTPAAGASDGDGDGGGGGDAADTAEGSFGRELGRRLVRDALVLLHCSRHGLREAELLELLAAGEEEQTESASNGGSGSGSGSGSVGAAASKARRGRSAPRRRPRKLSSRSGSFSNVRAPRLPPVVWARLQRALDGYLVPVGHGSDAHGGNTLGLFHAALDVAVARRYLMPGGAATPRQRGGAGAAASGAGKGGGGAGKHDEPEESKVYARLAAYFARAADPGGQGRWTGRVPHAYQDLVYYQLAGLRLGGLASTLGSLRFIEARAAQGRGAMEHLLRDYHDAMSVVRSVKYSVLKRQLKAAGTDRDEVLLWMQEFLVFASGKAVSMGRHPHLVFQFALNQPSTSAPAAAAQRLLSMFLGDTHRRKAAFAFYYSHAAAAARRAASGGVHSGANGSATGDACADARRAARLLVLSAVARDIMRVDVSKTRQLVPRRWLQWVNKPSRSRVVADWASFTSTPTCMAVGPLPQVKVHAVVVEEQHGQTASSGAGSPGSAGAAGVAGVAGSGAGDSGAGAASRAAPGAGSAASLRGGKAGAAPSSSSSSRRRNAGKKGRGAPAAPQWCVAVGLASGCVQLLDPNTGHTIRELARDGHDLGTAVTCLGFSGDGQRLVSGGDDCRGVVWDTATGSAVGHLEHHARALSSVSWLQSKGGAGSKAGAGVGTGGVAGGVQGALSGAAGKRGAAAGGRMLVTASLDASLIVWEEKVAELSPTAASGPSPTATAVATPAAAAPQAGGTYYAAVWTLDWLPAPYLCVAYTFGVGTGVGHDAAVLVGGRQDGQVTVWDASAPGLGLVELSSFHTGTHRITAIDAVRVPGSGEHVIATGGRGGSGGTTCVKLWQRQHSSSGHRRRRAAGSGSGAQRRKRKRRKGKGGKRKGESRVSYLEVEVQGSGHAAAITDVAFSPDARLVLSCGEDAKAIVWDRTNGDQVMTLMGHSGRLQAGAFAHAGGGGGSSSNQRHAKERALTLSSDKTVKTWDVSQNHALQKYTPPVARWAVESGNVAGAGDGGRSTARGTDGDSRGESGGRGHMSTSLVLPPGRALSSLGTSRTDSDGDAGTSDDGEESGSSSGSSGNDGDGGSDTEAGSGSGRAGRATLSTAFTLDGRGRMRRGSLVGRMRPLHDVAKQLQHRSVVGSHAGAVLAVAVRWDGRQAVTGSADCGAKVWDLVSGREQYVLVGHHAPVTAVAYHQPVAAAKAARSGGSATVAGARSLGAGAAQGGGGGAGGAPFAPRWVVTGDEVGTVLLWHAADLAFAARLPPGHHNEAITAIACVSVSVLAPSRTLAGGAEHAATVGNASCEVTCLLTGDASGVLGGWDLEATRVLPPTAASEVASYGSDGGGGDGSVHSARGSSVRRSPLPGDPATPLASARSSARGRGAPVDAVRGSGSGADAGCSPSPRDRTTPRKAADGKRGALRRGGGGGSQRRLQLSGGGGGGGGGSSAGSPTPRGDGSGVVASMALGRAMRAASVVSGSGTDRSSGHAGERGTHSYRSTDDREPSYRSTDREGAAAVSPAHYCTLHVKAWSQVADAMQGGKDGGEQDDDGDGGGVGGTHGGASISCIRVLAPLRREVKPPAGAGSGGGSASPLERAAGPASVVSGSVGRGDSPGPGPHTGAVVVSPAASAAVSVAAGDTGAAAAGQHAWTNMVVDVNAHSTTTHSAASPHGGPLLLLRDQCMGLFDDARAPPPEAPFLPRRHGHWRHGNAFSATPAHTPTAAAGAGAGASAGASGGAPSVSGDASVGGDAAGNGRHGSKRRRGTALGGTSTAAATAHAALAEQLRSVLPGGGSGGGGHGIGHAGGKMQGRAGRGGVSPSSMATHATAAASAAGLGLGLGLGGGVPDLSAHMPPRPMLEHYLPVYIDSRDPGHHVVASVPPPSYREAARVVVCDTRGRVVTWSRDAAGALLPLPVVLPRDAAPSGSAGSGGGTVGGTPLASPATDAAATAASDAAHSSSSGASGDPATAHPAATAIVPVEAATAAADAAAGRASRRRSRRGGRNLSISVPRQGSEGALFSTNDGDTHVQVTPAGGDERARRGKAAPSPAISRVGGGSMLGTGPTPTPTSMLDGGYPFAAMEPQAATGGVVPRDDISVAVVSWDGGLLAVGGGNSMAPLDLWSTGRLAAGPTLAALNARDHVSKARRLGEEAFTHEVRHWQRLCMRLAAQLQAVGEEGDRDRDGALPTDRSNRTHASAVSLSTVGPAAGVWGSPSRRASLAYSTMTHTTMSGGTGPLGRGSRRGSMRSFGGQSSVASLGGGHGEEDGVAPVPNRRANVAAFSQDGSLLAAGFDDRFVALLEASRPQAGAVALFEANGPVTAIGMGPGVAPWPGNPTPHDTYAQYAGVGASGAGEPQVDGGAAWLRGAGDGRIGLVVVGDATGRVFILSLHHADQEALADTAKRVGEVFSGAVLPAPVLPAQAATAGTAQARLAWMFEADAETVAEVAKRTEGDDEGDDSGGGEAYQ